MLRFSAAVATIASLGLWWQGGVRWLALVPLESANVADTTAHRGATASGDAGPLNPARCAR